MRRLVGLAALAACGDPELRGTASSTALPTVVTAASQVANIELLEPPGTYRAWSITIGEGDPERPCDLTPLVELTIYTIFDSAPRGTIPLSSPIQPVVLFPTAHAVLADGTALSDGAVEITAAATTRILGSLDGLAAEPAGLRRIDASFDAPTCD